MAQPSESTSAPPTSGPTATDTPMVAHIDAHRRAALAAGRELLGDERKGHREQNCSADPLDRAGDVEEGRIRRQAGGQR